MSAILGVALSKSYHHYKVLDEISFEVLPGECYSVFGRNGAGKTTLLKILATLIRPSSGRFELMDHDGVRGRYKVREKLFLIAHGSFLYNDLDAVENIRFALALRGLIPTPHEIKVSLDRVEIGAFSNFKIRHFSEGMKKRLAMAKAMLIQPKILLLDEPYSSLDERGMNTMNDFIRTMTQEGPAVFMTSHNRVKSAEVVQRAGIIRHGKLEDLAIGELLTADEFS